MTDREKLNAYISKTMYESLDRDALLFEVYRKDGHSINRNAFLSKLIVGYHDTYNEERSRLSDIVSAELSSDIKDPIRLQHLTQSIVIAATTSPRRTRKRGTSKKALTIRPTRETEDLIEDMVFKSRNEGFSSYFGSLLTSYCHRASYERERIIYKDKVDLLLKACDEHTTLSFSTTWDKATRHRVVPYKLLPGHDGQLNYLLCYEEDNKERNVLSYRLSRLHKPRENSERGILPETAQRYLSRMEKLGPQFAINSDEETCVRFTSNGLKTYQRIYIGRPMYSRAVESNGDTYLYFKCSTDQLYLYLRRFGPGEAEVVTPKALRERIIGFHSGALDMYSIS